MAKSDTPSYILKSEHLGFRNWINSDHEPYSEMCADPEVMHFFLATRTAAQSTEQIKRFQEHIDEYGFGFFAIDELKTGSFVGFIGMQHCDMAIDFCPCVEIGWRLRKEFWRRGYATEGARYILDHSKIKFSLNEIYSFTATENTPSIGVMKKIGMQKVSTFLHPSVPIDHSLCEHVLYKADL